MSVWDNAYATCIDTYEFSPSIRFECEEWDRFVEGTPLPLMQEDITRIASLGDSIDMSEVDTTYCLFIALLQLYADGRRRTAKERRAPPGEIGEIHTPFVTGIAGSVAAGRSVVAHLPQLLLQHWAHTPRVDLITMDGFLHPNKIPDKKGILVRKGFPEPYDRAALTDFLVVVKSGAPEPEVPVYSHVVYDIVKGEKLHIQQPDTLIAEGSNVLQSPRVVPGYMNVAVSDYLDFSIYVDVSEGNIEQWYVDRFLRLRKTAFSKVDSFFKTYANLSNKEAGATARIIWVAINLPNLRENISATREWATMAFRKDFSHRVESFLLRRG